MQVHGWATGLGGAVDAMSSWTASGIPVVPSLASTAWLGAGLVGLAAVAVAGAVVVHAQRRLRTVSAGVTAIADARLDEAAGCLVGLRGEAGDALSRLVETARANQDHHHSADVRCRVAEADARRLARVLDGLRDAVLVTDGFDEISLVNDAAERLFGRETTDTTQRHVADVVPIPELVRAIIDARERGAPGVERRFELQVEDATDPARRRSCEVMLLPVADDGVDRPEGVVTVLHDTTKERELAQMKTDFVAKASHELRTPLSSIAAYVEMLVDGEANDEASRNEFYEIIQSETERLRRLIDNMLNISRIEAGIVQVDRTAVDLASHIEQVLESLGPQAREKGIQLTARPSVVDLNVEGDSDMLLQVVLNLVSNAVKYTPEGGRITVEADTDNLTRSVVVSVSDTGLGIPPDALDRVFDKFYRIDNYKRVAKGTGLGLSLCKHIVEAVHHGQIGVESKLGMGSKFWFSVPMRFGGEMRNAA